MTPDEREYSAYTGNESAYYDYWYHQSAVIFLPSESESFVKAEPVEECNKDHSSSKRIKLEQAEIHELNSGLNSNTDDDKRNWQGRANQAFRECQYSPEMGEIFENSSQNSSS